MTSDVLGVFIFLLRGWEGLVYTKIAVQLHHTKDFSFLAPNGAKPSGCQAHTKISNNYKLQKVQPTDMHMNLSASMEFELARSFCILYIMLACIPLFYKAAHFYIVVY